MIYLVFKKSFFPAERSAFWGGLMFMIYLPSRSEETSVFLKTTILMIYLLLGVEPYDLPPFLHFSCFACFISLFFLLIIVFSFFLFLLLHVLLLCFFLSLLFSASLTWKPKKENKERRERKKERRKRRKRKKEEKEREGIKK